MEFAGQTCNTLEELWKGHEMEIAALDEEIGAKMMACKKKEKKQMEVHTEQMMYDLKARHRDEEDELEEYLESGAPENGEMSSKDDTEDTSAEDAKALEIERAAARIVEEKKDAEEKRIAKAKRKKEKKNAAEDKKLMEKEQISNEAGPSLRELELQSIGTKLLNENLIVKEIPSDGNCLYRAIADQLDLVGHTEIGKKLDYKALRIKAAKYMRENSADFLPFLDLEGDGGIDAQYTKYCGNVEGVKGGEVVWGGQMEVQALCKALMLDIHIYDALAPVVVMEGSEEEGEGAKGPLKLTYHRHYFSLGEHYNSVQIKSGSDEKE